MLNALFDAGFEVTVLSRSSSHKLDSRAKIQVVDYASRESLVTALTGQDAVVSTLNVGAVPLDTHVLLAEAAQAANVKRFIPSEFGCDTSNPITSKLPVFGDKVAVLNRLRELTAKDSAFTWTAVITGPFFDWGLQVGFITSLAGPTVPVYNGGDARFSSTTLSNIGRAIAGVLQHTEETKNRHVRVADAEVTQHEILQWSGKAGELKEQHVSLEELEQSAYAGLKQTPPDHRAFAQGLILRAIFDPACGSHFKELDNDLLGISKLTEPEIAALVKQYA